MWTGLRTHVDIVRNRLDALLHKMLVDFFLYFGPCASAIGFV